MPFYCKWGVAIKDNCKTMCYYSGDLIWILTSQSNREWKNLHTQLKAWQQKEAALSWRADCLQTRDGPARIKDWKKAGELERVERIVSEW